MPKEKFSLLGMLLGYEPNPLVRIQHTLSGGDEGSWGEICLAELLKNRMPDAAIFQNIYVPLDGGTTELDVVLVGQTGIYVLESKAYGGKIYGHPENQKWIQYLGRAKHSFYNPVKQNENHCRALSQALPVPRDCMHSCIVFENRADLSKVSQPIGDDYIVCNRNRLISALQRIVSVRPPVFSQGDIVSICHKLEDWSRMDGGVKRQHIQQVQNRMFGDICPVCGKKLVQRRGKYGLFIGCSGYPACTYTREYK